jgi:hypothetical protein
MTEKSQQIQLTKLKILKHGVSPNQQQLWKFDRFLRLKCLNRTSLFAKDKHIFLQSLTIR